MEVKDLKEKLKNFEFRGEYIPEHMHQGIINWVVYGIRPGGFLNAIIENDLMDAVGKADPTNYTNIRALVGFFYNETPHVCHGSVEKAKRWEEEMNKTTEK